MNIVDVEKKAATSPFHDLGDEVDLRPRALGKSEIGRRILEQHLSAKPILNLIDMRSHARKRFARIGDRREIIEKYRFVRRPGQVLREEPGLVALDETLQPLQVIAIKRTIGADRQSHAVERERIVV